MTLYRRFALSASLAALLLLVTTVGASAHQPYFEGDDWTARKPYTVKDPTISTALYATLDRCDDVDYVTFTGKQGQSILVGVTIPQIEGQDEFAPTVAVMGPGLPKTALPAQVTTPRRAGAVLLAPTPSPAPTFFEPFSHTSYWERQEELVTLPTDGRYVVAVWHEAGATGRYTLVVGQREVFGGDPAFPFKLRSFWTPVPAPASVDDCSPGS
jgi:hypothetical protein